MKRWVKQLLLVLFFLCPFIVFVIIGHYELIILVWPISFILLVSYFVAWLTRNLDPGIEDYFIIGLMIIGPVFSLIIDFNFVKLFSIGPLVVLAYWILFKVKR